MSKECEERKEKVDEIINDIKNNYLEEIEIAYQRGWQDCERNIERQKCGEVKDTLQDSTLF